ncbi:NAD(P)/FAD-dependent oxidoreductase [Dethiobacter alkaliphilus]|uniref:Fad dependent oxidoreductase, putative n=1 Tax=Dethiobacter alkaliphilus AHT 1 TaxID=555088 RepID=C0GIB9_DETAL|nr:NAD(P)/FAD-dependent oxidoreductase [Dethiobacter alkaliphilus]EEG76967.1 fad dependent oxidoreductase, putative [Dethiobacter alkaliphilus AHT 1]
MLYDVGIIGGGPAAIFAAYELVKQNNNVKVAIFEEGNDIHTRKCPIAQKKVPDCIKCTPCDVMRGFGGAGAFSDGKYNFTTEFGGWLNDYMSEEEVMKLIAHVDAINLELGAPNELFSTENSTVGRKAIAHDIHLLRAKVRHLGTENNLKILEKLYDILQSNCDLFFNSRVEEIIPDNNHFALNVGGIDHPVTCNYLIAAPGRAGSEWFAGQCKKLKLKLYNNQVDVGVRVEIPAEVFEHITDEVYEAKLVYRTKQYGDLVRTFCMNPKGYVVAENTDGIVTVNGHSYRDEKLHSNNTNFALLVSNRFTEPFNAPLQYGKSIASFSNMLGGGVLVQRFGDLIRGRRTNEHRLGQSFITPTLEATPGDLSLVLPKRHLDNIIEMIYALDKIAPGMANNDTLLYGVEVKFYSSRLKLSGQLETDIPNMFAIGDGAGITRGLSQASASGVHVARVIGRRIAKKA